MASNRIHNPIVKVLCGRASVKASDVTGKENKQRSAAAGEEQESVQAQHKQNCVEGRIRKLRS
jgi:hypothetical protein